MPLSTSPSLLTGLDATEHKIVSGIETYPKEGVLPAIAQWKAACTPEPNPDNPSLTNYRTTTDAVFDKYTFEIVFWDEQLKRLESMKAETKKQITRYETEISAIDAFVEKVNVTYSGSLKRYESAQKLSGHKTQLHKDGMHQKTILSGSMMDEFSGATRKVLQHKAPKQPTISYAASVSDIDAPALGVQHFADIRTLKASYERRIDAYETCQLVPLDGRLGLFGGWIRYTKDKKEDASKAWTEFFHPKPTK